MKVLSVITAYPPSTGGAQIHAHQLNLALRDRGVDIAVAAAWRETRTDWALGTTARAPGRRPAGELDGIPIDHLGLDVRRRLRAAAALAAYPPSMRAVAPALTAVYADEARRVLDRHHPDVLHISRVGREWLYQALVREGRRRGIPYVLTPNHHPHWTRPWHWWWWELYRGASAVLVLSDHEGAALVAGGVDPDRIIRTVVGPVGEPPPGHPPGPGDGPGSTIVFLGQVRRYKGLDVLADAVDLLRVDVPDLRLDVVGPWLDAPENLRARLEADPRTTVRGAVDEPAKWAALQAGTLLCVPSEGEALGGVYLEAWRAGRPAVGADIPPVRELFERTGGGIVSRRDPRELAGHLRELLDDPQRRASMAAAGRHALDEEYSWDVAAARAEEAYRRASG